MSVSLPVMRAWRLVPGPVELPLPCVPTELHDVAVYAPHFVESAILEIPEVSIIHRADVDSWNRWEARWMRDDRYIEIRMEVTEDERQVWLGCTLKFSCLATDLAELWSLLRERLSHVWLHDPQGWLYTPDSFRATFSPFKTVNWHKKISNEADIGADFGPVVRLLAPLFPELNYFPVGQRSEALDRARKRTSSRWRSFLSVILTIVVIIAASYTLGLLAAYWPFTSVSAPSGQSWLRKLITRVLFYIALSAIGTAVVFFFWRRPIQIALREMLVNQDVPICIPCGYDLRRLTEPRCPECGSSFDPKFLQPCVQQASGSADAIQSRAQVNPCSRKDE